MVAPAHAASPCCCFGFPCPPPSPTKHTALLRRSKALVLHSLPSALPLCSGAAFLHWVVEIQGSHFDFIQGYGMTESTAVLGYKTGSFLPPGSSGELLLRGLSNPKGREDSHFEDLQSMVKSHLKCLLREIGLGHGEFKEIARCSAHCHGCLWP
ncbi:hypothetical protein NL676_023982 [Syzygium grande]|nr:hypothetical protein NL676_023982 [Syzygium grande]